MKQPPIREVWHHHHVLTRWPQKRTVWSCPHRLRVLECLHDSLSMRDSIQVELLIIFVVTKEIGLTCRDTIISLDLQNIGIVV